MSSASSSEANRAESSGDVKTLLESTIPLLDRAILRLKGANADNLGRLEQWGLDTFYNKREWISVRKPHSDRAWGKLLVAYAQKESQQPVDQRIRDPSFEQMSSLAASWQNDTGSRDAAQTQREQGIDNRGRAVAPLRQVLRLAATTLVVTRYNGVVIKDLLSWGFDVVEYKVKSSGTKASGSSADGSADSGSDPEQAAAPAGSSGTAGSSTAGTPEDDADEQAGASTTSSDAAEPAAAA